MTLADISCAAEMQQAKMVKIIDWKKYPIVDEWFSRMMEIKEMQEAAQSLKERQDEFPIPDEAKL